MVKKILTKYCEEVPDFNANLLSRFREEKLNGVKDYLNDLFEQSVRTLDGNLKPDAPRLKYLNYSEMTPVERIEHIRQSKYNKEMDVNETNLVYLKYNFEYMGEHVHMVVPIPFIDNWSLTVSGVDYFPLFSIVEKGGFNRLKNGVIIDVLQAKIRFERSESYKFKTLKGRLYRSNTILTKLHQKPTKSAKRKNPPILLYHAAKFGMTESLIMLGYGDKITVTSDTSDDTKEYIKIKNDIFIMTTKECLYDKLAMRLIVSILLIGKFYNKFSVEDMLGRTYHKAVLGRWTNPSVSSDILQIQNADKHLRSTETMIDLTAMHQLRQVNIDIDSISSLLTEALLNLDEWLYAYNPIDLHEKKIGSLDLMLATLVMNFNHRIFKIVNSKLGLNRSVVNTMMKSSYGSDKWYKSTRMFRGNPNIYNDNYLLAVGANSFRSLNNTEIFKDTKTMSMSKPLLKAHVSNLTVESLLSFPSSNPIISGSINPYLEIDDSGNIIAPDFLDEISDVFDIYQ